MIFLMMNGFVFEVNIMSGVRLTRKYLHNMIEKKEGRVIFIASEAAIMPSQEMAHYSATKTMQLSISAVWRSWQPAQMSQSTPSCRVLP